MASVPPGNPLVPSLHFSPKSSPSLPPSRMLPKHQAVLSHEVSGQPLWEHKVCHGHHWLAPRQQRGELGPSVLPSPSAGKSGHSLSFYVRINRYCVRVLRVRLNTGKATRATQGEKMVDTYCMQVAVT